MQYQNNFFFKNVNNDDIENNLDYKRMTARAKEMIRIMKYDNDLWAMVTHGMIIMIFKLICDNEEVHNAKWW